MAGLIWEFLKIGLQVISCPFKKKQDGKKLVIGDNLTSHLSVNVLKLCEDNDIKFVCLPPNSSHLTQPLDVAYFRPLKSKWREILSKWKESDAGKKVPALPKDRFPLLLKTALQEMEPTMVSNLKAGFKKAGIFPFNRQEILDRLPKGETNLNLELVSDAFIAHLDSKRQDFVKTRPTKKRKLQVPPGKSISAADVNDTVEDKTSNQSNKRKGQNKSYNKKLSSNSKKKQKSKDWESTSEDADDFSLQSSGDSEFSFLNSEFDPMDLINFPSTSGAGNDGAMNELCNRDENIVMDKRDENLVENGLKETLVEGNFVIVLWEKKEFPGIITKIDENGAIVECMQRTLKGWKWPEVKDILHYKWGDIKKRLILLKC